MKKRKGQSNTKRTVMTENTVVATNISKFIQALTSDNFSDAHKYLGNVVNEKLRERIEVETSKPFFK